MYILGLNEALGASAALLKDGEIVAAASEERFTRIKNCWGFPKQAIRFCLDYAGITPQELNQVVLSYTDPYPHFVKKRAEERIELAPHLLKRLRDISPTVEYHFPILNLLTQLGRDIFFSVYTPKLRTIQYQEISHQLGISKDKIVSVDHHMCHAYAAYFTNLFWKKDPTLILTCDGAGDNVCATVTVVRNSTFERIASTPHIHSLGLFYAAITGHLGLKAHEDEYKVMGLASYVSGVDLTKLSGIFKKLVWTDGLVFKSSVPARQYGLFLKDHLSGYRFDHIAAAAQIYIEEQLVLWIDNCIKKTGIKNVACGGGVFLNVKANSKIINKTKARNIFFMPSPGDDTNAIGAAYQGYALLSKKTPRPLHTLYLGPASTEKEIRIALAKYKKLTIEKPKNINVSIAKLLAQGEIVARCVGRMEFGARALGNRSILADPRKRDVVERLNKMIKMRDFWMPFAPTILDEHVRKYLSNQNAFPAPYMIVAFETTEKGKHDLAAAVHPFDKSVRPQVLKQENNPEYYDLIKHFKKITGVGAVLNTSFNIHGEPIVANPVDALKVFERTDLQYLQLNNFLIKK